MMELGSAFTNENAEQQMSIGERDQMMKKIIEIVQFQEEAKKFIPICQSYQKKSEFILIQFFFS